jgi:LuxR family maltose regulon positive regulatory protein
VLDARVTLVSGPVGSGKTTGVAQWARSVSPEVAWLSLDTRDDDPKRWQERVLMACGIEGHAFDGGEWVERFDGLRTETVLVCDGVESLSDPLTVGDLDELCLHAPPRLHVVLAGRSTPVLPSLTRLRLAGELHEINGEDLRCRDDEAADVLAALGNNVDNAARESLLAHTEGLIAAVALAGVLGKGRDGLHPIADFAGDTPEFAQYLYSELIGALPVDVFGFMLATSVFEILEPAACNQITGRTDAAAVLADLAWRNALTEAIDNGENFRYHRLLIEFLRAELKRGRPERWSALHRGAAAHYERHGNEDRALHHWIEAGEVEEAWSRFRRRALPRFFDGAVTAVAQWTEMLPRPNVAIDVGQALDMALTLMYMGDVDGALDWSHLADSHRKGNAADIDLVGRRAYVQFLLTFAQGDLLEAARRAKTARELLATSTWSWDELRAPCAHAMLQSLIGHPARARTTLNAFIERAAPHHATDKVAIPCVLAEIALAEGKLAEAEAYADQALEASQLLTDPEFWFTITPRYVRGVVSLERNRLAEARDDLERACALGAKQGFVHAALLPLLALSRVLHLTGDDAAAMSILQQARRLVRRRNALSLLECVEETEALIAIADGELERARETGERLHEPYRSRVLARLGGRFETQDNARPLLDRLPDTSRRDRIELLLLRARGLDEKQSLTLVRNALALGESDGYVRVFVDQSEWLQPLVRRLVGSWPSSYAAEIAAAIVAEPDRHASARNLSELSEREQEVWRFLSTSLSMQEIADALYVSRNTLKSHVRSIYRKLGVGTREAAVGRGHGIRRVDV